MYICNKCKEEFAVPDRVSIDAGSLHDVGVVRRYKAPVAELCPHCNTTDISEKDLAKVV